MCRKVIITNLKEIFFLKFPIGTIEGLCQSGITTFDEFLYTSILTYIYKLLRNPNLLTPVLIGGIEGVRDLVGNQHIINSITCLLPHRKRQDPCMNIKAGSLNLLVFHNQVFRCQKTGKHTFYFKIYGH